MKTINLSQGKIALIDDQDYDRVLAMGKWYCVYMGKTWYAIKKIRKSKKNPKAKVLLMHRFILNVTDSNILVDHEDHYGLNNQRSNIRTCTRGQNQMNTSSRSNSSSKYLGVSFIKSSGCWRARLQYKYKEIRLGHYKTELEAAQAYNKGAKEYFGTFANLNKI